MNFSKKALIFLILIDAIVIIIGAFFKINHFEYFWINGNNLLLIGLLLQFITVLLFFIRYIFSKK